MIRDRSYWSRLESIFQATLECPDADRAAFLDRACAGDEELRGEIAAMLAVEGPHAALEIERLVRDGTELPGDADPMIGMRLGPWRLIAAIGHGGMGTVYAAERADGHYEQRVALKITRGSAHHPGVAARFRAETHILARLAHPNIAALLDAGFTPEGSAYLVMEYVDGSPIDVYCDALRLGVDDRLRIFRVVCEVTQHAHQSLVVHRDLKPSNILVSHNGDVKLLDFGIATLLDPDRPVGRGRRVETRALTPDYAAPEQLRGEPVTTAADVYMLGVVLHELLTGCRPGANDARDEDARTARSRIAADRGTTPSRLARRLAGDIDRVLQKALQHDPVHRYGTAGQLADDLQRLLDGRTVSARPDSLAYRARRFVARHRVGVSMAALLGASGAAFAVVAALQARAVAIERDRARAAAARAERVSVLVTDLFKLAEPGASASQNIRARDLLDRGNAQIATELAGDPATQAALFNVVGSVYGNLALHDTAIQVLQRALDLEQKAEGHGSLLQADTLQRLGALHMLKNDYRHAEPFFREALELRRALDAQPTDVATTLESLGRTLSMAGRHAEAEAPLAEAVAIRRRDPAAAAALMSSLNELAVTLHRLGDMTRAEPLFKEAAEVGSRIAGASPDRAAGLLNQARYVQQFDRDAARAEPIYREALQLARTIYPADHEQIATCLYEFARDMIDQQRLAEADALAHESMAMFGRLFGTENRDTLVSAQTVAQVLELEGKRTEAEPIRRDAVATAQALFGDEHPMTNGARADLASLLESERRFPEALELRQTALSSAVKGAHGSNDIYVALALSRLGQHGLASGRFTFAESYFARALDVRKAIHRPDDWHIDDARGLLGVARMRGGRYVDAEADLLASYRGLSAHRGASAPETLAARHRLHELYASWDRPDEARLYRDAAR